MYFKGFLFMNKPLLKGSLKRTLEFRLWLELDNAGEKRTTTKTKQHINRVCLAVDGGTRPFTFLTQLVENC